MRATVKKKGAANDEHQQPLKSELPSHTPKQQQQGKPSLEDAELQRKMKTAAKEFVQIYRTEEPSVLPSWIYCTPIDLMLFRLGEEWIRLTKENVEEACKEIAEDEGVSPEFYAKTALRYARDYAKAYGRVGWVLPKLQEGGVA
jgi:hypothetical protein